MNERDIFLAAIQIADPAERAAYLDEACADDAELGTQVEELLKTHNETSQFLETLSVATDSAFNRTVLTDASDTDEDSADERASGEAEFRKYLEPATRPGWLGRLAHYEIEEILGRGAFGIVAKAFDEKLHRVVAIKLMAPELAATSPPRKRFLREARTATAVVHENIVAIHAVEEEPIPYLVMEYIPGHNGKLTCVASRPAHTRAVQRTPTSQSPSSLKKTIGKVMWGLVAGLIGLAVYMSLPGPKAWLRGAWDAADHNGDGVLTREEMELFATQEPHRNGPRLMWNFDNADTNANGIVDDAEIEAYGYAVGSMDPEDHLPPPTELSVHDLAEGVRKNTSDSGTPRAAAPIFTSLVFDGIDDYASLPIKLARFGNYEADKPFTYEAFVTAHQQRPESRKKETRIPQFTPGIMGFFQVGNVSWGPTALSAGPTEKRCFANVSMGTGQEHHLALVWDGQHVRFFVNGLLKQSQQPEIPVYSPDTRAEFNWIPFQICGMWTQNGSANNFAGTIRELLLSTTARYIEDFVPADILETDAQTLGLYHINDGQGNVLKDSSGNENHGTIFGATWVTSKPAATLTQSALRGKSQFEWPEGQPAPAIAPFSADEAKAHQQAWAKHLGVPVEYENSIGMKFRLIPPGEFMMGSTPEEIEAALKVAGEDEVWRERINSEAPQHKVVLTQPVYVGVNEVTQAQYQQVMGTNPSHFSTTSDGKDAVANLATGNHPAETVSWNDAAEFCAKLSQQEQLKPFYFRSAETVTPLEGTGYRLPTEAEWESACRAGTTTRFWSGDEDQDVVSAGWFGGNSGARTHAAGELKANPFGLFDIHGNVKEWVQDSWDPAFYGKFEENAAINPSIPLSAGSLRVVRGGNWDYSPSHCRSSSRCARHPRSRYLHVGFRVVLVAESVRVSRP